MKDRELMIQLSQAVEGLLWLSESDYPWETVYIENVDRIETKLLELTPSNSVTKIEIRELDNFFKRVTQAKDEDEEELQESRRYQALVDLLKTHLRDIKVYRVGECEIKVYILGKTELGKVAGLSTMVVET
ncbi:MAG: nuclease A inhibitor family protein [Xenococcaceae cyanobacterium]